MAEWNIRENSLDVIRLFAASQVAILHSFDIMLPTYEKGMLLRLLELFPGVPIFFFISGFLISKSYENTHSNVEYSRNRILRLYPALLFCVFINVVMIASTGYFTLIGANGFDIALLVAAKATFLQFWNPDFMRSFGDGVFNGSLWTICVELQFYVLTPLIYLIFRKYSKHKHAVLLLLIAIFLIANRALYFFADDYASTIAWKLYRVSFGPWFYMFLTGIFFQLHFQKISTQLQKVSMPIMLITFAVVCALFNYFNAPLGNQVNPVLFFFIVFLIFRFAYWQPTKINQALKGNDYSYGIYIWHMPIVNQIIYSSEVISQQHVYFACLISLILAVFSWHFIEKPCLRRKRITLRAG